MLLVGTENEWHGRLLMDEDGAGAARGVHISNISPKPGSSIQHQQSTSTHQPLEVNEEGAFDRIPTHIAHRGSAVRGMRLGWRCKAVALA